MKNEQRTRNAVIFIPNRIDGWLKVAQKETSKRPFHRLWPKQQLWQEKGTEALEGQVYG